MDVCARITLKLTDNGSKHREYADCVAHTQGPIMIAKHTKPTPNRHHADRQAIVRKPLLLGGKDKSHIAANDVIHQLDEIRLR